MRCGTLCAVVGDASEGVMGAGETTAGDSGALAWAQAASWVSRAKTAWSDGLRDAMGSDSFSSHTAASML
jgi:hypothetical protein